MNTGDTQVNSLGHFATLDGQRGLAAFAVILYHICIPLYISVAPRAYLAVDFFFALSGFVVANAYESKLLKSLSLSEFRSLRLQRLYPLFLIGLVMGATVSMVKHTTGGGSMVVLKYLWAASMGALFIPFAQIPMNENRLAYPFNGPAWSLFFELAVNFAYALVIRQLSTRVVGVIIALSGVLVVVAVFNYGNADIGGDLANFLGGFPKVVFSFSVGVLLFRLTVEKRIPTIKHGGLIGTCLLMTVLMFPAIGLVGGWYDVVAILIAFPFVLAVSIGNEPAGQLRSVAKFVGSLSYPLYITHYPIMRVFQFVAERWAMSGAALAAMIATEIVLMIGFAYCVGRFIDGPLQKRFRRLRTANVRHDLDPTVATS